MSDTKEEPKVGLSANTLTNSQTSYSNFLFGENLADRVLLPAKEAPPIEDTSKKEEDTENGESNENGESSTSTKLPEKRKYEVITGEEDESNVLQIFCKLYLWDSTSALWKEKGKGMLRLNDKMKDDKICSRLVMRTAGSLKVILNASIVSGMKFELSNENCLRFINIDGIYLFKGKEKEIEHLNSAIETRLRDLSKKVKVDNEEIKHDKVNNEPLEGVDSKNEETSKEEDGTKEIVTSEQATIEGSQSKNELENNEYSDENSRKENVPEEENKTNEQSEDNLDDQQSNSKTETITNTEEAATSPADLDQK